MRTPRIYHPHTLERQAIVTLEPEASQHLIRVLRMNIGDKVSLFNGEGGEYLGVIEQVKNKTEIKLIIYSDLNPESPLNIHLGQGLARNDRMDFIIQKATELGVTQITPLITATSMIKLDAKKIEKKLQHWKNIIISAAQQCGRTHLPMLHIPLTFQKFINEPFLGENILFDPQANKNLKTIHPAPTAIRLLVGPESGFNESEVVLATQQGFEAYTLGPRILRTETASITALATLQALYGDL